MPFQAGRATRNETGSKPQMKLTRTLVSSRKSLPDIQPQTSRTSAAGKMSSHELFDVGIVKQAKRSMDAAPWYILRPTSKFCTRWDLVTALALVFTAIVTPFEVAFLPEASSMANWLWITNRLVDLVFICDMAMQFGMMFPVGQDQGSGTAWEFRLRPIALRYLKGWFIIDVFSLLPSSVDILPFVPGSGLERNQGDGGEETDDTRSLMRMLRVARAMRLIKLVRLARLARLFDRWRTRISIRFSSITAIQLCLYLVVGTHWMACMLKLQATFADRAFDTWCALHPR
jgi:hypothetical protein